MIVWKSNPLEFFLAGIFNFFNSIISYFSEDKFLIDS